PVTATPAQPAPRAPAAAATAAPGAKLSVAQGDDGSLTVRFDWDEPVAAATFRRSGFLWLVFDKRANVNVQALQQAGGGVIRTIQQLYIPQATVLRMKTLKGMNPSVRRQGNAWLIDFRKQDMIPRVPIELQVQPDTAIGARLFMPLAEPGKVIPLTDPLVGDSILVIPAVPLGHGVAGDYRYPQFDIQQSGQGIVITPKIDDIRVRALRQGVEIASAAPTHSLKFTPVSKEMAASARAAAMRPLVRLLDLEKWETRNPAAIQQTRGVLETAIAKADDTAKQAARMNLARFYFANAFSAEALGVLARVQDVDKQIVRDREFMLLRGASKALLGRLEEARQDLYADILNGNDEAEFWRAIVQAKNGDLNGASIELRRSGSMARPYPLALRFPLSIIVAEAMVTIGDTRNAKTQVQTLQADGPNRYQAAHVKYVQGRLAELEGNFDGAVAQWEDVMLSPDRLARYRSALARAELLMRLDRITRAQGIEEIEKQRFAWRGDNREFAYLRRLGDLYLEENRFREALQTLKQAATYFRDHPQATAVTKLMSDTFSGLYLEGKADVLPPVTAIAIYEEFRELTPAGAAGDKMIQKLADRLVGVDLLKEAAALLESQIKFRLRDVERARVGARLALIHMLDRKFADAERVLKATPATNLTPQLTQKRNHLLAQALMGQQRYNDALAPIARDKSMDAELLRAEIFWFMANWVDAAQSLQTVLNLSGARRGDKLNRQQARYMLNLATAMTLSGNERGLASIRANFAPAMATTEYAKAFTLIAARPALGLIAPSSVADRVKVAENFKSFLTAYRERLEKNPLSAIN
ncbi:MAG: tetratricopeptide repeat protein, partial [Rhodospirillaceae bacterium]